MTSLVNMAFLMFKATWTGMLPAFCTGNVVNSRTSQRVFVRWYTFFQLFQRFFGEMYYSGLTTHILVLCGKNR